jgi:hypothetical protein
MTTRRTDEARTLGGTVEGSAKLVLAFPTGSAKRSPRLGPAIGQVSIRASANGLADDG